VYSTHVHGFEIWKTSGTADTTTYR